MESNVVPRQRNIRRSDAWSDREDRFISTHRKDGYVLIAEGLRAYGHDRSPNAVKAHARRALGLRLPKWPESGMRKCIACGRWDARPNTQAGRAGFCPTCWARRKADAYAESLGELDAIREYHRWRKYKRTHLNGKKGETR